MPKIGIIGYGGLGRQIEDLIKQSGLHEDHFLYFDDQLKQDNGFPFNSFLDKKFANLEFVVGLGYRYLQEKKKIITSLHDHNLKLFTYIHPTAFVDKNAKIGQGCVIYPMCNIDRHVVLEDGVLLNNSVVVSHDSVIGNSSFIAPSACICGGVRIGECTFVGAHSAIADGIIIGERNIIGIGSCITKSTPPDSCLIGNPARQISKISFLNSNQ